MRKSFKQWTRQELKKVFGIEQEAKLPALEDWLAVNDIVISEEEKSRLQSLLNKSLRFVDSWNETELRERFIIKVLEMVDFEFEKEECHSFAERYLSATYQGTTLYGYVDWMVATGFQFPEKPFFFLHEYKAEGAKELDGRGQLLSSLFAAQILNENQLPMYGTFVQGRLWFFIAYDQGKFAESSAMDILKFEDLCTVYKILLKQKQFILNRIKAL